MFFIILISILLSSAYLVFKIKLNYSYWQRRNVPSYPSSVPFGSIENIFKNQDAFGVQFKKFYDYFKENCQPHGGVYMLSTPVYVPVDPTIIKSILVKDFHCFYGKGLYVNEKAQPIQGNIFQIQGEKWRHLRSKLSPTFTSGKLKLMFPTLQKCTLPLVNAIENLANNAAVVDIKDITTKYALNVIGSIGFGIDCDAFQENSEFSVYSKKLVEPTKYRSLIRAFLFACPELAKKFNCIVFAKDAEDFFTKVATENAQYREKHEVIRNDFFQLTLDLKRNATEDSKYTMQDVVNQTFVFFLAGFESSAKTMTYALLELANNVELQERTRDEINAVIEQNGEINYQSLDQMKYLQQVIDETLRKYPPLAFVNRECNTWYAIPGTNLILEPGTKVYVPVYAIHRDPEYYPEPERFDPDRFSEANKTKMPPCTYLPFSDGPRNCIAMRFAHMQNKIALVELLRRYKFTLHEGTTLPLKFKNCILALNHTGKILLKCEKL